MRARGRGGVRDKDTCKEAKKPIFLRPPLKKSFLSLFPWCKLLQNKKWVEHEMSYERNILLLFLGDEKSEGLVKSDVVPEQYDNILYIYS